MQINFDLKCVVCGFPVIDKGPEEVSVECKVCNCEYFRYELENAMKSPFFAEQFRVHIKKYQQ